MSDSIGKEAMVCESSELIMEGLETELFQRHVELSSAGVGLSNEARESNQHEQRQHHTSARGQPCRTPVFVDASITSSVGPASDTIASSPSVSQPMVRCV